jgi:hypothetical protein
MVSGGEVKVCVVMKMSAWWLNNIKGKASRRLMS